MVRAEITEVLMKSLPQLFAKHQADERRLAEVILMPQIMTLDLYAEMGMNKVGLGLPLLSSKSLNASCRPSKHFGTTLPNNLWHIPLQSSSPRPHLPSLLS